MDLIGNYIGSRYEVIEKVGNGGMATVYKAKDKVLNRFVAVKVLKEEFTTDMEFIRRFNAEAQSAAGFTHPNIVSVYDVGHDENIYYIVMELVQGKTLKQIIIEDGTLPWKWATNVAIQIASALEAAHKNNIIHRDIKPHNIIITEDGVAKVTDFGIAKAVSNSTITAFGTTIGSVHYFSPEHARGGITDAKSDLYSLGVVMYEMLTGKVPFDADTPVSIALKHMQEKLIEPMKLNPSIPLALNQIIVKAMQKDPSMRYQSATEMLKDLNMALKNPEGRFADEQSTQKIPVVDIPKQEKNKEAKSENKDKTEKKDNIFKKYPWLKFVLIGVIALILAIAGFFIARGINDAGTIRNVAIPELTGLTKQEVEDKLKEVSSKLTYEIKSEEYSSDVEAGKVISQEPAYRKNYTIKENTNFTLVISKGVEMVKVPKIVGMTYDEAVKELEKNKLKAEKVEEVSETVEAGIVIGQEVEEGTEANAGTTIKVTTSIGNGLEKVLVPYVVGKTEENATKDLVGAKLAVEVIYEEDKSKSDGVVLKQSIEVSQVVDEGTTVMITVNKIAQIKDGTVNINLKTLTGYADPKGNETKDVPSVKVKITVDGENVYEKSHKQNTTQISTSIQGKGNVEIKVYVDNILKQTKNLDMNGSNPVVTFE
ncbi:MAG: Stk1 family PASTA domain-containing Ser/Thr kinase [Clostridia bacterium]|nr:Stk1 family PASTA domain-containing Ser/Thr kinase [Clostridia bacterium]